MPEPLKRQTCRALCCGVIGIFSGLLTACDVPVPRPAPVNYVTHYGLGPDKWATAWLLTRHVDPSGQLVTIDSASALPSGVVFDERSSDLRRTGNLSAFEITKAKYKLDDPVLNALAAVVHDIEINLWNISSVPEAALIEEAYRGLQYANGRDSVSPECYVAFFDRVYQVIDEKLSQGRPLSAERLRLGCTELIKNAQRGRDLVPEIPLPDVLDAMAAGRKVIFVDVREVDEYQEAHIPGAINLPIRAVSPRLKQQLQGADYVVSYCVKDFRGFEMAKALAELGVENSVIMRPYGIKGWIAEGLPVVGTQGATQAAAETTLARCLTSPSKCKSIRGAI